MSVLANNSVVFDDNGNAYFNDLIYTGVVDFYLGSATNYGYTSGGYGPTTYRNEIQRFPFALSITNSADVGDLIAAIESHGGQSSPTHGYTTGGSTSPTPPNNVSNVIQRFPFALAITNSADVGDLTVARYNNGSGNYSQDYGYMTQGATVYPSGPSGGSPVNVIDRFPFALAITNATDVGDTLVSDWAFSSSSSPTHGYIMGNDYPFGAPIIYDTIERFPFALAITNTADVGSLSVARFAGAGLQTLQYGYTAGGAAPGPNASLNVIDRFPFALSIVDAADVGDLTLARHYIGNGQSSSAYGYVSGGITETPARTYYNNIDRFAFVSPAVNASDVGDLAAAIGFSTSQQY